MSKYVIKVECTDPEFKMDERFTKGLESDGFAFITFDKDNDPEAVCLHEVNIMMLARAIEGNSQFKQATAIAEGLRKAKEIRESEAKDSLSRLASLFGGHGFGGSDDE